MDQKVVCEHCGPNPINHTAVRLGIFTDWLLSPVFSKTDVIWKTVRPYLFKLPVEQGAYKFMRFLAWLRLGMIITRLDEHDSWRTRCLWEAAEKRGITMERFQILHLKNFRTLLMAHYKGQVRIFDGLPRPRGPISHSLDWMDDKGTMREHFQEHGIPVARGGTCRNVDEAVDIFKKINGQAIVKPRTGSRSRHTTVHITNEQQLIEAFYIAKQLSPWVVVEEELRGMVFRATVIGGNLVGVIRREPPHVIGNGGSTVLQLIQKENENPSRQGPIFHHISVGSDAEQELARQGLTLESIPRSGELIFLGQKVGRGSGGSTTDFTDRTHQENKALFERIGRLLNDPLVGIDFMIEDIEQAWTAERGCGVIECNSLPFIDLHHYPLYGSPKDAAGALWDLIFPDSSVSTQSSINLKNSS